MKEHAPYLAADGAHVRQRGLLKLHDDLISQRKRAPDRSGARSGDR